MERATVYAQTHYCKTVLNSAKELTAELLTSELRRGNHIKSPEIVKQFTSKVVLGGLSGASINKITLTYDPPDVGPPTLILKVMYYASKVMQALANSTAKLIEMLAKAKYS